MSWPNFKLSSPNLFQHPQLAGACRQVKLLCGYPKADEKSMTESALDCGHSR